MRSLATVFLLIPVIWVHAQSDELIIQGQTGGLYLEHAVAAKETWYSVGRLYNVDPKVLAHYNHLTFAHSLTIGEELKVPLTAVNFSQDGKKPAGESLVPVYHIVGEKEWLYRISVNHNKVPIPVLEKWNHVTGDQVHAGLHMIVGYLKVKTALSALAKRRAEVRRGEEADAAVRGAAGSAGDAGARAVAASGEAPKAVMPPQGNGTEPEKEKMDTTVVAAAAPPRVTSVTPARPVVSRPAPAASRPAAAASEGSPAPHFDGGKFRADFTDGGRSMTGQAGVFKSTSGWQDGKYYALINTVPVGTIVKITDQATGKSVYAKVLGQLPDMKESVGLTVRLSNAAAAELGEGEVRFGVGVSY